MKVEGSSERTAFRVLNNIFAFTGGDFFYHFINFLAGILVARSLGSERYGQFSFIFVYLSFFEIFIQFGLNAIVTREMSQKTLDRPRILGSAILLRLVLAGCTFPLALLLIRVLGYPLSVQQGIWVGSFQLFLTLRSLYETVFRVHLLMIYPAIVNGIRSLVYLALVVALFYFHPTVISFVLASLGSGLLALVGIGLLTRKFLRISFRWEWNLIKHLAKESFPLVFSGYLTLLYYRIDVFMISMMKTFADVGYYSVATRLTESLDIVAVALMMSLTPLLSRAFKEDQPSFDRLISKGFQGLLAIGLPMAVGGTLVAGDLILFLFGKEYGPSAVTLGILFWYTFFGFFSTLLVNVLIVCEKQIVDVWISFFLVLLNIGMNCLLIPPYSHSGAAAATVLTEVFGSALMLAYTLKQPTIRLVVPFRELGKVLKVNAFFIPILLLLKFSFSMPIIALIPLAALIYLLLLFRARLISFQEVKDYLTHSSRPHAS